MVGIEDFSKRILKDGEYVLWTGRPDPERASKIDRHAMVYGAGYFLLSVPWPVLFWIGDLLPIDSLWLLLVHWVSHSTFYQVFAALGLLVALVLFARPFFNKRRARRTYYAVTNRRLVIFSDRGGGWIGIPPEDIERLTREDAAGFSDILFKDPVMDWSRMWRVTNLSAFQSNFERGFWGITDGAGAENAIRQLRSEVGADVASVVLN